MNQNAETKIQTQAWVEADFRLAGMLDSRMIGLLRAIDQTGSINQAAKQCGLSYKGAWQIIERANNLAPKVLIATATGGSKGGGTKLTAAGQALLALFDRLEKRHRTFLQELNQSLLDDPDLVLLLKRQVIKASARNQLFGTITDVRGGAVYAEVFVTLKGGEEVVASITQPALGELPVEVGGEAVLLVNAPENVVAAEGGSHVFSA
ncbi:MAG: TOBE domain-containing protein, partial [Methylomonas sp.]